MTIDCTRRRGDKNGSSVPLIRIIRRNSLSQDRQNKYDQANQEKQKKPAGWPEPERVLLHMHWSDGDDFSKNRELLTDGEH
jgi:hypothetical protein